MSGFISGVWTQTCRVPLFCSIDLDRSRWFSHPGFDRVIQSDRLRYTSIPLSFCFCASTILSYAAQHGTSSISGEFLMPLVQDYTKHMPSWCLSFNRKHIRHWLWMAWFGIVNVVRESLWIFNEKCDGSGAGSIMFVSMLQEFQHVVTWIQRASHAWPPQDCSLIQTINTI